MAFSGSEEKNRSDMEKPAFDGLAGRMTCARIGRSR